MTTEQLLMYVEKRFDHVDNTNNDIKKTLEKINGRIGKAEDNIRYIEKDLSGHVIKCPIRIDVERLKQKNATEDSLESFIIKQNEETQEKDKKRNRQLITWVTVISLVFSVVFGVATFIIYFTADAKIGVP